MHIYHLVLSLLHDLNINIHVQNAKTDTNIIPKVTTESAKEAPNTPKSETGGKCPWPFILLHDFKTGMEDYKSKIVLGLLLCWLWSCVVNSHLYREFVSKK
mmetsp:Transcript_19114/g.27632  ORF Transcript_19114/g.27632 Transcript_19114/m.27632 type:complete len:101 (-) Transcript_19114:182-484(-)